MSLLNSRYLKEKALIALTALTALGVQSCGGGLEQALIRDDLDCRGNICQVQEPKRRTNKRLKEMLKNPDPLMIYISSENCPFCPKAESVINEIAKKYEGKIRFERHPLNRDAKKYLGARAVPSVFFVRNGEVTGAVQYYVEPRESYVEFLDNKAKKCLRQNK